VVNDPVNSSDAFGLRRGPEPDPSNVWQVGDPLPQPVVNGLTGLGNGASFGLGDVARRGLGFGNSGVNTCSTAYQAGNIAGSLGQVGLGTVALARGSFAAATLNGRLSVVGSGAQALENPTRENLAQTALAAGTAGTTGAIAKPGSDAVERGAAAAANAVSGAGSAVTESD